MQDHELSADEKRAELTRVVNSTALQNARQLQRILEFVGAKAISDDSFEVNEFTLAAEVFGRSHDFDPAADTTVRTSVYRLRSKLREYYAGEGRLDPVFIEIPKGHYCPLFKRREPGELEATTPDDPTPPPPLTDHVASEPGAARMARPSRSFWPWLAALLAILCVLSFVGIRFKPKPPGPAPFDLFWAPFLSTSKPTLIYTGTNVVYRLPRAFVNRYSALHHVQNHGLEYPVQLGPDDARYLQPDAATFITKQDSFAAAAVASLLSRRGSAYSLRYGPDVSFGDLRYGPTILIGAFNNYWTLEMTNDLRYVFDRGDTIEDQSTKGKSWSVHPGEDWALISRVLSSKTGAVLMTIAGVGAIGTQAAGEFVASPQKIADLAKTAPPDWSKKNMQIVLHTRVIDDTPGATNIVATYYW